MERKEQQKQDEEQKPMAQQPDQAKRKPKSEDEQTDETVGKVNDPQGEKRDNA
jgi:hypothetical protein